MIIDVSAFNGKIDWKRVAKSDIDLAIIRIGYGRNVKARDDKQFENNINGAIDNNIPVSVYIYSYADGDFSAEAEAEHALRLVEPYKDKIERVFIACEEEGTETATELVAKTFYEKMAEKGYQTGIRAPISWFENYVKDVPPQMAKWVIAWGNNAPDMDYLYWQYTNTGHIDGINTDVAISTIRGVKTFTQDNIDGQDEVELVKPKKKKEVEAPVEEPAEPTIIEEEKAPVIDHSGTYFVDTKNGLNLRSGAGTENSAIGILVFGTKVVSDGTIEEKGGATWIKVTADKIGTGWCNMKFLRK